MASCVPKPQRRKHDKEEAMHERGKTNLSGSRSLREPNRIRPTTDEAGASMSPMRQYQDCIRNLPFITLRSSVPEVFEKPRAAAYVGISREGIKFAALVTSTVA